jgi:hypothetical protein
MGWKYVMIETTFKGGMKILFPVIFPDKMIHSEVAAVAKIVAPMGGNTSRVVSAGKIEHIEVHGLGGDSETLKLSSKEEDATVIERYSYFHGVVL